MNFRFSDFKISGFENNQKQNLKITKSQNQKNLGYEEELFITYR